MSNYLKEKLNIYKKILPCLFVGVFFTKKLQLFFRHIRLFEWCKSEWTLYSVFLFYHDCEQNTT